MSSVTKFRRASNQIAFDTIHKNKIRFNISRYDSAVERGIKSFRNLDKAKSVASSIKKEVLQRWDKYLIEFEKNITKNGAEVLWASDTTQAAQLIEEIIKTTNAKLLVKSKSMTTEEIELNELAESIGCQSVETDLGEFIVQVAGEKPYHIVTPAMHKSKEDVAKLFHEKFGTPTDNTPEQLTEYVRNILRKKFQTADLGVTGANFLIADIGGISVTENEGNALMSISFPKTHIVIAGIEKIIPSIDHLGLLYPLLAVHGTGQKITAYNTIITGPKKNNETDGSERMIVILIDNKRTEIYANNEAYISLSCIRCGACLNGCPVYKTIGGYTYDSTYSGPIGSVITPFFKGFKDYAHLSFSSTLCGKCNEVCPVKIPLTNLLLNNRKTTIEKKLRPISEKLIMKGFQKLSSNRKSYDIFPFFVKNIAIYPFNFFGWGNKRKAPSFSKKSFSQQYKKRQ